MRIRRPEGRFITKEFAATIGKKPRSAYLRLHDPVQRMLFERSLAVQDETLLERAYPGVMVHFWKEVSLAGMPRTGRWMDECFALLFESTYAFAEANPEWAEECFNQICKDEGLWKVLRLLARHTADTNLDHINIREAFATMYAPWREADSDWGDEQRVAASGNHAFWAAILCQHGISKDHNLWTFRRAIAASAARQWGDQRLHTRLIRGAPQWAQTAPLIELMEHPLLRIARLKYAAGSVEHKLVMRFLNQQCINQRFESEEDCFGGDLTLAQWFRDARRWARALLKHEPETCAAMFRECGVHATESVRRLFYSQLGPHPRSVDDLDATAVLMRWLKRKRGFDISSYRAQQWEFIVEMVDAALWLGWSFPDRKRVQRADTVA